MSDKKVTVKVSATSANLGGGFDCLGAAFELYHTVTAEFAPRFSLTSNLAVPTDKSNLIYTAMNEVFKRAGKENADVIITSHSDIPQASGLGSSAACLVAGVVAANALCGDVLSDGEALDLCTALDGHPDNVLPALVGGVTAGVMQDGHVQYVRCVPKNAFFAVATPDFPLETKTARAVLPESYSRADCVYSLSRAALVFGAFATDNIRALSAMGDKLHEPYRIPLIKGFDQVSNAFKSAGAVATCLSGAGPSVLAVFASPIKSVSLPAGWTLRKLKLSDKPAKAIQN